MLLSIISKFLASLLVVVLTVGTLAVVLGQTLLNSHFIESKLKSTDSYNRLSVALTDELAKQADPPDPTIKDKLKTIITPDVIQQKTNTALDQLQAFYQGNGPVPSIQLQDLVDKAKLAGIPIGDDKNSSQTADMASGQSNGQNAGLGNGQNQNDKNDGPDFNKPIALDPGAQVRGAGKLYDNLKIGAVVLSLALAALLLVVSWERHRWAALPDVLMNAGVLLGILAMVFTLGPSFAANTVKLDQNSNALAAIGQDLAAALTSDVGKRLGMIAALYFVVGLAVRIWLHERNRAMLKLAQAKTAKPAVKK